MTSICQGGRRDLAYVGPLAQSYLGAKLEAYRPEKVALKDEHVHTQIQYIYDFLLSQVFDMLTS